VTQVRTADGELDAWIYGLPGKGPTQALS
jgi:hypothetical protein